MSDPEKHHDVAWGTAASCDN